VQVTDVLPDGLHFVDAQPRATSQQDTSATWVFPTIGTRASREIVVRAALDPAIDGGAPLRNVVMVSDNQGADQDVSVLGHVRARPSGPPVTLSIFAVRRTFPGSQVRYTFNVKNSGAGSENDVTLVVQQPPGTTFVLSTPPPSTNSGGTLMWRLGTLMQASKVSIRLTTKVSPDVSPGTVLTTSAVVTDSVGDRADGSVNVNVVAK
jgi:uncharacterized repeat protein (TIGR01451 family)